MRAQVVAAVLGAALCGPALPADRAAGKARADAACAVCHGPLGVSVQPDAPHLAGQPAIYLAAQLKAYRAGQRRHEVMAVIARTLSDAEIADLAAWYSSIRFEASAP